MVSRFLLALLGAGTVASSLGCYSYLTVSPDRLSPGEDVRARLHQNDGEELRNVLGTESAVVEGEVISRDGDALLLYVPAATRRLGFHSETLRQRIRISIANVVDLQRRELNRGRTTLVAAVTGVAIGIVAWQTLAGKAGANTSESPGDGVSESLTRPPIMALFFLH